MGYRKTKQLPINGAQFWIKICSCGTGPKKEEFLVDHAEGRIRRSQNRAVA
jgi:hypothetical protein